MKSTLLLFVITLIVCCTPKENPLDKSIIEPLTIDELRAEIEKDGLFERNYERIDRMRERIEKAKYSDVSYRQVNEFLNWIEDTTNLNKLWRETDMAWEKKYGHVVKRVDSTIAYWEEFCDRNGIKKSRAKYSKEVPKEIGTYITEGGYYNKGMEQRAIAEQLLNEEFGFKDEMFGDRHDSIAIADYGIVGELFLLNQ